MAVESGDWGTLITGNDIERFRLISLRSGFRTEINTGMRMSMKYVSSKLADQVTGNTVRSKKASYAALNKWMVENGFEDLPL